MAADLNGWLYGAGGLCAEATTRGAILGLRLRCQEWAEAEDREMPGDFYEWRNLALRTRRADIDLAGLEQYDSGNMSSALQRLKAEVEHAISGRGQNPGN